MSLVVNVLRNSLLVLMCIFFVWIWLLDNEIFNYGLVCLSHLNKGGGHSGCKGLNSNIPDLLQGEK